ncbi:MAG: hypothetical protein HKN78_09085 [Sphingomonadaceae bacterium]|nr:hypothetical protein [Sphingomonadaceae bacterium]
MARNLVDGLESSGHRAEALEKFSLDFGAGFAGRRMAELRATIWPDEPEPSGDQLGTEFYLFLLAAWHAGLARFADVRSNDARRIGISDGSFYRVMAKAHIRGGLDLDWLASLFRTALRPAMVILLDIDPAEAWKRRDSFKETELGRWDGIEGEPEAAFCRYQEAIRQALLGFALEYGWPVIRQTAETTPEEVMRRAHSLVTEGISKTAPKTTKLA